MQLKLIVTLAVGIFLTNVHGLPRPDALSEPQIVDPTNSGDEGLGPGTSTTIWGNKKREGEAQAAGTIVDPAGGSFGTPSSTVTWVSKNKRKADTAGFGLTGSKTTWGDKDKREADPQSLGPVTETVSWSGSGPTASASSCSCVNARPGNYCGFCPQIQGSWFSWDVYHCGAGGSCKDLGFNEACISSDLNKCPF
ncbi:hypothetical protein K432DRAFT_421038 [Lepidopterella palustris CBS 459.81]|uniref:Uncharacterized protein n=1 Tax=Lepidopterella palustris CBS 459.81 TaxID=1314670 RepID=A0A8E2JL73_9PEZI|nr:hypothetical protein K432DRAFT_421038 [Lepidopterella palustris CBS 459.81]